MAPHLTECGGKKICLSTFINTCFSIRSSRLARAGAAVPLTCSPRLPEVRCNNSQPLVHDNEWVSCLSFLVCFWFFFTPHLLILGFKWTRSQLGHESSNYYFYSLPPKGEPADRVSIQLPPVAAQTYEWQKDLRAGCWLSDCCASSVHPEGKLKSPSMHAGPRVKWVTYKCSLVAACVVGMGRANEISAVLKAEGRRRWMDASFMTGGYEA